jgi:hypothetical protein
MAAVRPRGNVPMRPLRWTIEAVGREFKLAQNTVRKILHQGGAEPDGNGCFSTEQVVSCLFGDLRAERLRKERELVKKYRRENSITEASVLNRVALSQGFAAIADAMVCRNNGKRTKQRGERGSVERSFEHSGRYQKCRTRPDSAPPTCERANARRGRERKLKLSRDSFARPCDKEKNP